ncbi:MAG: hypothetical protein Kow00129_02930 [Thermoleophilia bacterium]
MLTYHFRALPADVSAAEDFRGGEVPVLSGVARTAIQFVVLMTFWLALSGKLETKYVTMGALSVALVLWKGGDLLRTRYAAGYSRPSDLSEAFAHWLRFLRYLPWLLAAIVKANLQVAYVILHPRMPIDPVLVRFRTNLDTDMEQVLLAHSITLTPGTVTIDVQNGDYLVHALTAPAAEGLVTGDMQNRVARVFGLPPHQDLSVSVSRRISTEQE